MFVFDSSVWQKEAFSYWAFNYVFCVVYIFCGWVKFLCTTADHDCVLVAFDSCFFRRHWEIVWVRCPTYLVSEFTK